MERKKFSKFFSFISNFLKVSFLSAIVALGFSYNSSVKAADLFDPPSASQYTKKDTDTIPQNYIDQGYTFYKINGSNVVYAAKTDGLSDGQNVDADAIILSGSESSVKVFDKFEAPIPNATNNGKATCNVKTISQGLLEQVPANAELEVENIANVIENSKNNFNNSNKGTVYLKIDPSSVETLNANIKAWAKAINAQDATVTLKDLGAQYVSYKSGDKLSDVKSKLTFSPAESLGEGTWTVTSDKGAITDTIQSGTQKLIFSFEVTPGKGYGYKDTSNIEINLKETQEGTQTPSVSKSKIVYTAKKTTWKELINEAGVTPSEKEAKGHWTITKKDGTTTYYDPTSNEAGKDGSKSIESGISEVVFNYVPKSDSEDSYKATSITVTLVEGISCKDFNIKANVSGNNPTLKDVQLPSGSDTKVVDGSGSPVSGTWKWSDESKSVAKFENTGCEAVFTPTDTAKYPTITKNFKVYNLGKKQTFGDHTFSVSGDGVTSGTVSGKGITWIRESSGGTAAWYGFDNSDGILPEGATVAVRWIGAKENPEEYAKYVEEAKRTGKPFEDNKLWVFEVRAFDSDMNEIKDFGKDEGGNPKKIKFYIESGDDWDSDDVIAFFVDTEGGNPELWDVSLETKSINGEEKEFIVAKLSHLSVHFVGDEKKAQDVLSDLQKAASDAGTKYKLEHPEASLQDLQKVQFEAMQKAYEQLSDDDKKLVADYAEFLQKSESEDSGNSSDNKVTPQSDSSSSGSSSSTQKSTTSSSPSTTTSSSKIKTGSDVSNLMFLMQYVFGTSLGTAIISRKKKFD